MGHALDNTMQDILIRWKRMQGYNALWVPGTDHAAISTEVKIVNKMREEGLTKEDIGREGFLKRAWAWKEEYGSTILNQLKKLGSSGKEKDLLWMQVFLMLFSQFSVSYTKKDIFIRAKS